MTVVPKHDYSDEMDASMRYRFSACSQCGARTEAQANEKCTQSQSRSGDYYCASSEGYMSPAFDAKGRHCTPTNKEMRAEARRFDEYINSACEQCGYPRHACTGHAS